MQFFESSNALESLRSSDFDNLSAYAEVVDNSIQAEATKINIHFQLNAIKSNWEQIEYIAFSDNGCGMNTKTLHACLKLGWSSRYNDRSGIGRFGVGMVLGAIHECQRIEVYSKQKDGEWLFTYIDLEEVAQGTLTEIPFPTEKFPPEKFNSLIEEDFGTLVIWSKYDRQKKRGNTIIKDFKHYFGRTFRKFIWDSNLSITLNGEEVNAFDPLYARTEKTRFPDDPKAVIFEPMIIDWPIPNSDQQLGAYPSSPIKITMSRLPEEFRKKRGDGGSAMAKERKIDENEGISILRNNREVFYGNLPYWSKVRKENSTADTWPFMEMDRWWGCEIEFDAILDSCFSVKNIKRGAEPETDLKQIIKARIGPTRISVFDEVRRVWDETKQAEDKINDTGTGHSIAETAARNAKTPVNVKNKNQGDAIEELRKNQLLGLDRNEQAKYEALFSSQPFTIQDSQWSGGTFFEVTHGGGNIFLSYNTKHLFFETYYQLVEEISEDDEIAKKLKSMIDLLIISSAKSQALHEDEYMSVDTYNDQWGMMLREYTKAWEKDNG